MEDTACGTNEVSLGDIDGLKEEFFGAFRKVNVVTVVEELMFDQKKGGNYMI